MDVLRWLGRKLLHLLSSLGIWLIGLVLLFEEWGWERLARILAWIGDLPGLRWIEGRIRALPPYAALGLFIVPILTVLPLKLLALYWLGRGHTLLGISVIVAAKVGGTAITARLFMLTQATLMQLPWFARWFGKWIAFKDAVLARVKGSLAWQQWTRFKARVKKVFRRISRWWRRG